MSSSRCWRAWPARLLLSHHPRAVGHVVGPGLFDLLFVGYVALLVRMRNLAAEREMKLTFTAEPVRRRPGGPGPAGLRPRPAATAS